MKFLANENFPGDAVKTLRRLGNDVSWIRETAPGINDVQVREIAQNESRILTSLPSPSE